MSVCADIREECVLVGALSGRPKDHPTGCKHGVVGGSKSEALVGAIAKCRVRIFPRCLCSAGCILTDMKGTEGKRQSQSPFERSCNRSQSAVQE